MSGAPSYDTNKKKGNVSAVKVDVAHACILRVSLDPSLYRNILDLDQEHLLGLQQKVNTQNTRTRCPRKYL